MKETLIIWTRRSKNQVTFSLQKHFILSTPTELRILQHSPEYLEYRTNKDDVNASSILVKKKKRLDSWRHKWNIIASYAFKSNNVNTCVNINYIHPVFNFLIEVFCVLSFTRGFVRILPGYKASKLRFLNLIILLNIMSKQWLLQIQRRESR